LNYSEAYFTARDKSKTERDTVVVIYNNNIIRWKNVPKSQWQFEDWRITDSFAIPQGHMFVVFRDGREWARGHQHDI
jgi:hypothetical protein